jgi:hypothetical protein
MDVENPEDVGDSAGLGAQEISGTEKLDRDFKEIEEALRMYTEKYSLKRKNDCRSDVWATFRTIFSRRLRRIIG